MPTVAVLNMQGTEVEKLDLNPSVFGADVNTHCVRAVVNRQMARRRQGNAATKTRGMVKGSTAKPWKQKGSGRARAGRVTSPIWRGGGTVFGPHPRSYGGRINRKVVKKAIVSCLSAFAQENELVVLENIEFPKPKTKQVTELLGKLKIGISRILILTEETNENLALSVRNLPYVDIINCDNINAYDLTTHDVVIATSAAIKRLEEVYTQ